MILLLLLVVAAVLLAPFSLKDLDIAGLSGGGLDLFGVGAAQDAAKANKANLGKIGGLYDSATRTYVQDQGAALNRQKQVTAGLQRGLKTGLLNLAGQGNAARQGILDRGQQQFDTAQSGLEGRGVMSEALTSTLKRSNNYDVNQALGGIDEAVSRLAAEFQQQGEGAIAGSGSRESGLLSGLAEGKASLTKNYMDILSGVQHQAGVTPGQQLLQLGAMAFGGFG